MMLGSFSGDNESNNFSAVLHVQAGVNGVNCSKSLGNPSNDCVAHGELGTTIEGFSTNFHATDVFSAGYEDEVRTGLSDVMQLDQDVSNTGLDNLPSLDGDFRNHLDFGANAASLDGAAATIALAATGQGEPMINSASNEQPSDLVITAADLIDDVNLSSGPVQENGGAASDALQEHPLFINPELLSLPEENIAIHAQPANNNLGSTAVTIDNTTNFSQLPQEVGMDIDTRDVDQVVTGAFTAHPYHGLNDQNAQLSRNIPVTVQGSPNTADGQCEKGTTILKVQEVQGMPCGNGAQGITFGEELAEDQDCGAAEVGARIQQPGPDEYNHIVATMQGLSLPSTATAEAPRLLNVGGVSMVNPLLIGEGLSSPSQVQAVPNTAGEPQRFQTQHLEKMVLPQKPVHLSPAIPNGPAGQPQPEEIFFAAPGIPSCPLPPIGSAMDIGPDASAPSFVEPFGAQDCMMKEASPSNSTSKTTKKGRSRGASRHSNGRKSPKQHSDGGGITANRPISKRRKRTRTRVEDMDPADVHVCTYHGCGRKFAKKYNLTVHERGHRGELPYKCEVLNCGKPFMWLSSFSRHLRVHEKKRKAGSRRSHRRAVADSSDRDAGSPNNMNHSIANGASEEASELLRVQALVNTVGVNGAVARLTHRAQVLVGKDLNIKAQLEERWKSFGCRKKKVTNSQNLPFDIRSMRLRQFCTQTF